MLTLYTHTWACATAIHILLERLELPYKAIEVAFWDPEYKKINPAGAVPALKDSDLWDDFVLTQLPAIAKYILRKKFGNLFEWNSKAESLLDSYLSMLWSDVHTAFAPIFAPHAFTISTEDKEIENVKQAGIHRASSKLSLIDTLLWEKKYLLWENITVADLYLYVITTWAQMFFPEDFSALTNLVRFNQMIWNLPEVKKVYEK